MQVAHGHSLTLPWHCNSEVLRLPRQMTMEASKALRLPQKNATHLFKTLQKYRACHRNSLSTLVKTRENVKKPHACHAKRRYNMFSTPSQKEV